MCMSECLHMAMYLVCAVPGEARGGQQIARSWSYRWAPCGTGNQTLVSLRAAVLQL